MEFSAESETVDDVKKKVAAPQYQLKPLKARVDDQAVAMDKIAWIDEQQTADLGEILA